MKFLVVHPEHDEVLDADQPAQLQQLRDLLLRSIWVRHALSVPRPTKPAPLTPPPKVERFISDSHAGDFWSVPDGWVIRLGLDYSEDMLS